MNTFDRVFKVANLAVLSLLGLGCLIGAFCGAWWHFATALVCFFLAFCQWVELRREGNREEIYKSSDNQIVESSNL